MDCNSNTRVLKEAMDELELLTIDIPVGLSRSKNTQKALDKALNLGAATGNYSYISKLPLKIRQDIVTSIFSRDFENAKGLTTNQTKVNVNYFGTTTKVKPLNFLRSAAKRGEYISDKIKRKEFAFSIAKDLANGKKVEIGPPKLWLDIRDNEVRVIGHEGRHRADAIRELFGDDVTIPVDLQFTYKGSEYRARNLTTEDINLPVVSEDGKKLNNKLTTMYGITMLMILGDLQNIDTQE